MHFKKSLFLSTSLLLSLSTLTASSPSPQQQTSPNLHRRIPTANSVPAIFSVNHPLFVRSALPAPDPKRGKFSSGSDDEGDQQSNSDSNSNSDSDSNSVCPQSGYSPCVENNRYCCPTGNVCLLDLDPPRCGTSEVVSGLKKATKIAIAVVVVILVLALIGGITIFCCCCRAGGKWYKNRKAAKAAATAGDPALYAGGAGTGGVVVGTTDPNMQQMQPLNPDGKGFYGPDQQYHDQSAQQTPMQHPYNPNTAYQPQQQYTSPVQYTAPTPAPGQGVYYDPNQGYSQQPQGAAPPYGQH